MTEHDAHRSLQRQGVHPQVPAGYMALSIPKRLCATEGAGWLCFARHTAKGDGVLLFHAAQEERFLGAQEAATLLGSMMAWAADILPACPRPYWQEHVQELAVLADWLSANIPYIKGRAALLRWLWQLKTEPGESERGPAIVTDTAEEGDV